MIRRSMIRCCAAFSLMALALGVGLPVVSGEASLEAQQRMLRDIKYLASDELEGRGVGLKGLDLAAEHIREAFARAGLKVDAIDGGAYQAFEMHTGAKLGPLGSLELTAPDSSRTPLAIHSQFEPQSFGGAGAFFGEVVFAGYGIDTPEKKYDDFAGVDLKGKVALIMRRVPQQANPHGPFAGPHGGVSSHAELRTKVNAAFDRGVVAVLFVNDPFTARKERDQAKAQVAKLAEAVAEAALTLEAADPADAASYETAKKKLSEELAKYKAGKGHLGEGEPDTLMKFGYGGSEAFRNIPVLHIAREECDRMLKSALGKTLADLEAEIDKDLAPRSTALAGWTAGGIVTIERQTAEVKNVIGVLEGSGPLADETIVVGAHYDHVGRGGPGSLLPGSTEIHNGADDNASGTAALVELARRLAARSDALARRIVFIAFTAEESGLIGSARYTREPVFPLEKTIAMFNMDMVGRLKDNKLTVFGTGTSPRWAPEISRLGEKYAFELAFKPEGFGPSDHSSFYARQIPVLHFFTGNHTDYHRPSDDWEKINVEGAERVVDLLEELIVETASAPERPQYVEVKGTAEMADRGGSRPYFGSIPDFGVDRPGYALSGVAPGGPAEKGGLKAGDRIVQLGTHKVESLEDFDLALRRFSPGETVEVSVIRGDQKLTLKVTLDKPRGS